MTTPRDSRRPARKYPPTKSIFTDVDGTLLTSLGKCNAPLVEWLKARRAEGYYMVLWSARGKQHAEEVAHRFGVAELFDAIVPKPGTIVDDLGWSWTRYTRAISKNWQLASPTPSHEN